MGGRERAREGKERRARPKRRAPKVYRKSNLNEKQVRNAIQDANTTRCNRNGKKKGNLLVVVECKDRSNRTFLCFRRARRCCCCRRSSGLDRLGLLDQSWRNRRRLPQVLETASDRFEFALRDALACEDAEGASVPGIQRSKEPSERERRTFPVQNAVSPPSNVSRFGHVQSDLLDIPVARRILLGGRRRSRDGESFGGPAGSVHSRADAVVREQGQQARQRD